MSAVKVNTLHGRVMVGVTQMVDNAKERARNYLYPKRLSEVQRAQLKTALRAWVHEPKEAFEFIAYTAKQIRATPEQTLIGIMALAASGEIGVEEASYALDGTMQHVKSSRKDTYNEFWERL